MTFFYAERLIFYLSAGFQKNSSREEGKELLCKIAAKVGGEVR